MLSPDGGTLYVAWQDARFGLRICGPNCMGMVSLRERLLLYPASRIRSVVPGSVGLVFQSGGTGGLDLGVLSDSIYAAIVLLPLVTSMTTPVLLRLAVSRIKPDEKESERLEEEAEKEKAVIKREGTKILAATTGGPRSLQAMRMAAPCASVIFQRPATRNKADISTAAVQLTQVFHPGSSKPASTSPECAILSSMNLILALFSGLMGAQAADLAVTNARIYTLNPQIPVASAIAVKDGKVLAVGEVSLYSEGLTDLIAHAVGTYSIPRAAKE